MKIAKIFVKTGAVISGILAAVIFSAVAYANNFLSDNYFVVEGNQLNINCQVPITVKYKETQESQTRLNAVTNQYNVDFELFGIIPISSAKINVIDEMSVKLLGEPFGIKLYTDGVLVVGMSDVDGEQGSINPAKKAGIKVGDTIKSINGIAVGSNEDVCNIIENSGGEQLYVRIIRDDCEKTVKLNPVYSQSCGIYRIGIWVRDSSAGIGTLTFYSPTTNVVCGLGHGICDTDTGCLMSVSSGELVDADIVSYVRGVTGSPGELKGKLNNKLLGNLVLNDETGVYADAAYDFGNEDLLQIALKQEIKEGSAYIYTTIDGSRPDYYSCNIELNSKNESASTHNLIVTVTDKRLIDATGGIVQGMSGSPIVQNGKLVGAVTHVFINEPERGYGIFAENMFNYAKTLKISELKNAS